MKLEIRQIFENEVEMDIEVVLPGLRDMWGHESVHMVTLWLTNKSIIKVFSAPISQQLSREPSPNRGSCNLVWI